MRCSTLRGSAVALLDINQEALEIMAQAAKIAAVEEDMGVVTMPSMPLGTWGQWVGGLAAAAAVVLALFRDYIRAWWRRPRLQIDFENRGPFCRNPTIVETGKRGYWIRVKVTNDGGSVAKGCIGKLMQMRDANRCPLPLFDAMALRWVDALPKHLLVTAITGKGVGVMVGQEAIHEIYNPVMDLTPHDSTFLNIVNTEQGTDEFRVNAADPRPRGVFFTYRRGEYFLSLRILSENADPISKEYRLVWEGDYDNIRMEEV